ncbi:hypothetical protein V1527DRAFT_381878, partial [Lipomyces starkeyi]
KIQQNNVIGRLKSRGSKAIFMLFWKLNLALLQSAECQELSHMSATKISKTSREKTALTTLFCFSEFCSNSSSRSTPTSVVKSVHSTMAKQLLSLIPDDYIYPVCYLIAFKLVRIDSSHTFCIRCPVKLQHQLKDDCPQCGQSVLITATRRNIDISLYNQMLLYLPEETKQ